MYTGYKGNTSINKSISSVNTRSFGSNFGQSQLQSLQREVDNYTRKLQQEKRRFFNAQESYKAVMKEYEAEKLRLDQLKKVQANSETSILHSKIKNLEANLDKAISVYDDTLSQNNKLKSEIDMLRREKKNFMQIYGVLEQQIQRSEQESAKRLQAIQDKKKRTEMLKNQIINIKQRNSQEKDNCMKQFDVLQKNYLEDKKVREAAKQNEKIEKAEAVETQPILKIRLKKLIARNKEKVKIIDQYQRNIKQIEQAFEQIKQGSGISDLEEITNTFIKSEQQNYSLYNYVDILSQNIDSLEQQNRQLEKKIQQQKEDNLQRKKILSGTPDDQKRKKQIRQIVRHKQKVVDELSELVSKIQPDLQEILLYLARSKYNSDPKKLYDYELGFNMSDRNIEQYLSDLEKYINIIVESKSQQMPPPARITATTQGKQTVRGNAAPVLVEEVKEERQLLGEEELKKFAQEYIDKKKARLRE